MIEESLIQLNSIISYFTTENHTLTNFATLISLIIVSAIHFTTQKKTKKEKQIKEAKELSQASSNLHRELKDTCEGLNRTVYKNDALSFETPDEKEFFFMNRTLNHDFYDSLIFSGKINILRPELQQQVQNIFSQIKTHNKYIELVMRIKDETTDGRIPEKAYKYYEWLDSNEVRLLKDIPIMLKKLEKDFEIQKTWA